MPESNDGNVVHLFRKPFLKLIDGIDIRQCIHLGVEIGHNDAIGYLEELQKAKI